MKLIKPGINGTNPVAFICAANASSVIILEYRPWPDDASRGSIDISHKGQGCSRPDLHFTFILCSRRRLVPDHPLGLLQYYLSVVHRDHHSERRSLISPASLRSATRILSAPVRAPRSSRRRQETSRSTILHRLCSDLHLLIYQHSLPTTARRHSLNPRLHQHLFIRLNLQHLDPTSIAPLSHSRPTNCSPLPQQELQHQHLP